MQDLPPRDALLRKGAEWDFPASAWEEQVCAELVSMDVFAVPRAPQDQLIAMGMRSAECHENARWYADNDPSGQTRSITGWWVQWPNFVLHSVIKTRGRLICITPTPFSDTEIQFIPDSSITWVKDGEVYCALKGGQRIGPGVRRYPAYTMAQNSIVRNRILAGVDIMKAGEFTTEEMENLKRQFIEE